MEETKIIETVAEEAVVEAIEAGVEDVAKKSGKDIANKVVGYGIVGLAAIGVGAIGYAGYKGVKKLVKKAKAKKAEKEAEEEIAREFDEAMDILEE